MYASYIFCTCDSDLNTSGILTNQVLDKDCVDPGVMALCRRDHQLR